MKLIDKEKVVGEIKRRIEDCERMADAAAEKNLHNTLEANELLISQYTNLIAFIETIEEKDV